MIRPAPVSAKNRPMIKPRTPEAAEHAGVFGVGVAFALGDVHEEGGVFGDGNGAGFVVVEEGPVDDEEAVGGEGGGGFFDELAGFGEIPVVEEVGEEDESVGAAEGEEDIEGAGGEIEVRGDLGGVGVWLFVQPGEEVEVEEGGGDEFGGVLAITEVEDRAGIGGGEGGENGVMVGGGRRDVVRWGLAKRIDSCGIGVTWQVDEGGGEGVSGFSRGGAMFAEVFFAAVAEPDAEGLGELCAFGLGEAFVELEGAFAFAAAGLVVVGVPVGAGEADASGGFLDEGRAGEVGVVFLVFFGGHGGKGVAVRRREGVRKVEGLRR